MKLLEIVEKLGLSHIRLVDRMPQTPCLPGFEHETEKNGSTCCFAEHSDNLFIDGTFNFSHGDRYPRLYLHFGELGEIQLILLTLEDT